MSVGNYYKKLVYKLHVQVQVAGRSPKEYIQIARSTKLLPYPPNPPPPLNRPGPAGSLRHAVIAEANDGLSVTTAKSQISPESHLLHLLLQEGL